MENSIQMLTLEISSQLHNQRLDKALAIHPQIKSRSQAANLIQQGRVTLNGKTVKTSQKTITGQCYKISLPKEEKEKLKPYSFPLDIVYEDKDLIVINKPSHLVVHPSVGHFQDTLVNALIYHGYHFSSQFENVTEPHRAGIVHRIDKDASGLLVVAQNPAAYLHLCHQFKTKTAQRVYDCVVYGQVTTLKGALTSYLSRHPVNRKKYFSLPEAKKEEGKLAVTHYLTQNVYPCGISLMECQLETGRTHQIRVHMKELGHSILGDTVYTGSKKQFKCLPLRLREQIENMDRIALHAKKLKFTHPQNNKPLSFSSPWPKNLQFLTEYFKKLK